MSIHEAIRGSLIKHGEKMKASKEEKEAPDRLCSGRHPPACL